MNRLFSILFILVSSVCSGQVTNDNEDKLIREILIEPSREEIVNVLAEIRRRDLSPYNVIRCDSIALSNGNRLFILSHTVAGRRHFGAVIVPHTPKERRLPVVILATGGDGMNTAFDPTQDFNHNAATFPSLMGKMLDHELIIVIPSFRGQQLIIGDRRYQSEGHVTDAFDGATTDALAFLNVVLKEFRQADEKRIGIYGGSRGGTVALLASSRDMRISKTIAVAAPTDMKALYELYPQQFKLIFFNDLITGKISYADARKKFISISPLYFVNELQAVQLHHDKNDPFVPLRLATSLVDAMKASGKLIDAYYYDEGIHGFWSDEKFWKRVQEFIAQL